MKPFMTTALVGLTLMTAALPGLALNNDAAGQTVAKVEKAQSEKTSFKEKLNLSDGQIAQLKEIRAKFKSDNGAKFEELKTLRKQLREALSQPTVDKNNALAIESKITAIQSELGMARVAMMADRSVVFTPEQRQKMQERAASGGFRQHRGHRHFGEHRGEREMKPSSST